MHRDVKPGNVLVARRRPREDHRLRHRLVGLAACRSPGPGRSSAPPHYLSPEQADGRQASPASDVYALGLIGYECLAGRRAFDGDNAVADRAEADPRRARTRCPTTSRTRCAALIGRALLKDPAARLRRRRRLPGRGRRRARRAPAAAAARATPGRPALGLAGRRRPRGTPARAPAAGCSRLPGAGRRPARWGPASPSAGVAAGPGTAGRPAARPPPARARTAATAGSCWSPATTSAGRSTRSEAELRALGLRVELGCRTRDAAPRPAGDRRSSPTGTLAAGRPVVTVTYAAEPARRAGCAPAAGADGRRPPWSRRCRLRRRPPAPTPAPRPSRDGRRAGARPTLHGDARRRPRPTAARPNGDGRRQRARRRRRRRPRRQPRRRQRQRGDRADEPTGRSVVAGAARSTAPRRGSRGRR